MKLDNRKESLFFRTTLRRIGDRTLDGTLDNICSPRSKSMMLLKEILYLTPMRITSVLVLSSPSVLMANVRPSESDSYISILNLDLMEVLNGFPSKALTKFPKFLNAILQTFLFTRMMNWVIFLEQACFAFSVFMLPSVRSIRR